MAKALVLKLEMMVWVHLCSDKQKYINKAYDIWFAFVYISISAFLFFLYFMGYS